MSEFKKRFQRWMNGEKVYEAGKILPEVVVTADDPIKKLVEDVNARSNADFVNRAKDPNRTWIQDWENKNKIATHKLSWAEDNGKVIVYPEVQNINGKLHDFTDPKYNHGKWDALDSAIERGDTLLMTPELAKMYTENYKKYYPKGKTFDAGKPISKYDSGTDDKTYLPEYEYEATVTPQGVSAEKHKRITNEEDWLKYWGNVGAGYVSLALESVAKPVLEGLKTASYFTPLGNATAVGDLIAANINGNKDEMLASAAGLLPQVRWVRNAYKAGKQLMSLNQLWDRHYFHALNDKDLRGVKNLRDAHFIVNAPNTKIKNGDLPVTLYHGTPNKGWNEYDPKFFGSNTDDGYYGKGLYLTETLDDALAYAGIKDRNFEKFTGTKNPYLKRLYVNSETPFVSGVLNNDFKIATANEASDRAMLAPHFGRDLKFKIGTPGSESGTVYIPDDMIYDPTLVRELENADASIFSNVLHHVDRDPTIVKFDEVIVPKSSLMKYVDPITYDDFGNIIPLSMRDNFFNPDFRFDKGKSIHMKQRLQTPQKLYLNYDNELPNVDVVAKKLPEVQVVAPRIKTKAEKELEELKDPFALPSFEDYFNAFMESRGIMTPWSVGKQINPLKRLVNAIKYGLPMYDEGTNDNDGKYQYKKADTDWHYNWLNARKDILLKNMDTAGISGSADELILKQINTLGKVTEIYPPTRNSVADYVGGSTKAVEIDGERVPYQIEYYDPDPSAGTIAHERTHGLNAVPQETAAKLLDLLLRPSWDAGNEYRNSPWEIYAHLMGIRKLFNMDPLHRVTPEDVRKWREEDGLDTNLNFFSTLDDEGLSKMLNEIAYTNVSNSNLFYADKGKSIHIKPANRGKLTALKKRTGKSEAELYNDGNPAHKKMVVFARNARKWKH